MNMLSLRKSLSFALLLGLFCSASALAANVTVIATGDRSYSIQGSGMDGVAAIELQITYDEKSLVSPTATKGGLVSDAMFAPNTTTIPGMIKIGIISANPFSGSGEIAKISFERRIRTGGITLARVSMIDSKYAPVTTDDGSSHPSTPNQTGETPSLNQSSQNLTTQGNQLNSGVTTSLGTVTFPSDIQQRTGSEPVPSKTVPFGASESTDTRTAKEVKPLTEPSAEVKPEERPQYVIYKGVLDRFKLYDGRKKLADIEALFEKKIAQTIRQNPAIVISNGQDKVVLTIDIPVRIKSSPNFAVHGGTIASFYQEKQQQGRWRVEVLPEKGTLKVTVTIIAGAEEFEYPITVAPLVKTALTLDEKGWDAFISETGTTKIPQHDFNNDEVRNYIDEYIFAANIIAKKTTPERPAPATRLPSAPPPPKAVK